MIAAGPGDVIVKLLFGAQDLIEVVLDQVADADDAARASPSITRARRMRCLVMIAMTLDSRSFAAPVHRPIDNPGDRKAVSGREGEQAHHDRIRWHRRFREAVHPANGQPGLHGLENHAEPA